MDEMILANGGACLISSTAPGRTKPTEPTIIITEAIVEAIAALQCDRETIARATRDLATIYADLSEREKRIKLALKELSNGYIQAELLVASRKSISA